MCKEVVTSILFIVKFFTVRTAFFTAECSCPLLEEKDGPLLKMGGHWYRLDGCYQGKRRWTCARGCAARIHTRGKRLVFSDLRHRFQVIYNQKGYPKLSLDGYFYRPHNAYRNQPKVLWYCAARNKFQCTATLRTIHREVVAVTGAHNHAR